MTLDRKTMTSSALRRRRQAVKKLRAELKLELKEIEAEMEARQRGDLKVKHADLKVSLPC